MSLINDALKRAREAEQQRAGEATPATPLQPADHAPRRNWAGWIVLAVLLIATLAFAAIHLGRWAGSPGAERPVPVVKINPTANPAPAEPTAAVVTSPAIPMSTNVAPRLASTEGRPAQTPGAQPVEAASRAQSAPPALSTEDPPNRSPKEPPSPSVEPPAVAPAPVEARFPELKLQSIVFRLRNPSVMIDGQMLGVGETVKGARVAKIERQAVTMEWQGQTNILRLPQL
jgi:hypothetical protein